VTTLKLHYEGWLALPAAFRQKLGLSTGAALEAELVDGTIVLRPLNKERRSAGREQEAIEPPVELASPTPAPAIDAPATQEKGQTRKTPEPSLLDRTSAPKRPRGRPRKAEVKPEPAPAPLPVPAEPWQLRRKADRPVVTASDNPVPAPERRPKQLMREAAYEHEREERRPFRHVEIRKLGPGPGLTHEISRISARGAVSEETVQEQPRATHCRLAIWPPPLPLR
jgi:bifunctional DNA-binding transcriptional regulator/antitoxin component of YhaV-PrlF toxin-antitoxin module